MMAMILAMLVAGCDRDGGPMPNCARRPADFRSFADPQWYGSGMPVELLINRVAIEADGKPLWNGVPLGGPEDRSGWTVLETYLEANGQLEPVPLVTLVFPRSAPCAGVARARTLMRRHLACGPTGPCFQGPPPFS